MSSEGRGCWERCVQWSDLLTCSADGQTAPTMAVNGRPQVKKYTGQNGHGYTNHNNLNGHHGQPRTPTTSSGTIHRNYHTNGKAKTNGHVQRVAVLHRKTSKDQWCEFILLGSSPTVMCSEGGEFLHLQVCIVSGYEPRMAHLTQDSEIRWAQFPRVLLNSRHEHEQPFDLNKLMSEGLQDIQSQKGGKLHVSDTVVEHVSALGRHLQPDVVVSNLKITQTSSHCCLLRTLWVSRSNHLCDGQVLLFLKGPPPLGSPEEQEEGH
ncbi:hypothetical protein AAG570_003974 [Ranatra chinensis]|uniref:Uncharacterized protein n=1 Tax=Ranatra chinensis TaxID=642074 RepID=A0ABD0YP86_9HEMI